MADTCCVYTVAGITINATTGDCLHTDFEDGEITGLDGAPIRAEIDDQGQSDGGIVHPKFYAARIITFAGRVLIRSVDLTNREDYVAAVNTVEATSISALESFLNSSTTLAWTPTGGSAKSISVTYGMQGGEIEFFGNMIDHRFRFGLVAAEPAIT